ncbi:helix-turn-helix domain-containing protein [Psychroserpens burtonensis]|uniref:Helix-turn-helix domain-containing protein n=1 Tax=Psychroserpens burtonensis TaxID=49278 RepID=A0A5C7B8D8_9FLAO|nr:helix-turn-helix domain-containing protein [Psychroserpens burtonensis]TXE18580.1 helix-turn-helix domain-containing protein [Psychroserpens burtonensis]
MKNNSNNTLVKIKVDKNRNFTVINNTIVNDKRVSCKARGLFFTIMSLPDNWDFTISGITKILPESKKTIYRIINELIELGYCMRENEYNRFDNVTKRSIIYTFSETPMNVDLSGEPQKGEHQKGEHQNDPQLNTNNNKIHKKNIYTQIDSRKAEFKKRVLEYSSKHDNETLKNFFEYWTEHNENDSKMRFEKEKTFGIGNRLSRWKTFPTPQIKSDRL